MDPIIQEFARKYGDTKWINSHVSKGPIILTWRNSDLWIITDLKTEDYHFVGYGGRYILTGGNWREVNDLTPLHVYRRQLLEELPRLAGLLSTVEPKPFREYLEFDTFSDHGDKGLEKVLEVTEGDLYAIISVFSLTLEGEKMQEELKIPPYELNPLSLRKKLKSTESRVGVLTLQDLRSGSLDNFGAGDGEKLRSCLLSLDINLPPVSILRGRNYELDSHPLTPYIDRPTRQYLRSNPLEKDTRDPKSSFKIL